MDDISLKDLWNKAKGLIRNEVSSLTFDTWISPTRPIMIDEMTFYLSVPDDFSLEHILPWKNLIKNAVKQVSYHDYNIEFVINESQKMSDILRRITKEAMKTAADEKVNLPINSLNPGYVFESFVVGSGNRFAHAACVAVAEKLGDRVYNPLFLYGGSGLGKTHLMHAIGNYVKTKKKDRSVLYVQSEQFVNEFIAAIRDNSYDGFREKYRKADLLLIDDIQFIERKEQMQIEFFHTFNALFDSGKHIVMTCDKPPQSLSFLEERLRTRFASGLIVDIQPPDFETRAAILKRRAEYNKVSVTDDVIEYIALNVATNIRELEGAFNMVLAYSVLSGKLDLRNAEEALKDIVSGSSGREIDADIIIDIVARYYNVTAEQILSKRRSQDIIVPRQISMYLCRFLLNMTFPKIGEKFGGKDHTTVMHACNKMSTNLQDNESSLSHDIEEIKKRLSC